MLLPILIFLGIVVPTVELTLLFLLSQWIGFWYTVGLIIITGVMGAMLWRWQGFGVWGRLRTEMASSVVREMQGQKTGDIPTPIDILMDGALIFFAGGLLLTPGVMTDLVGLLLLIPATRKLFKRLVFRYLKTHFRVIDFSARSNVPPFMFQRGPVEQEPWEVDEDIIEAEIVSRTTREPGSLDKDPERLN